MFGLTEGIVKLRLTAVSDPQHGGVTAGSSPVSWGAVDELFVNLTVPLAAIRMLGDWLVVSQVLAVNPAAAVRGPKHVVTKGATPVLSPAEARRLLDVRTAEQKQTTARRCEAACGRRKTRPLEWSTEHADGVLWNTGGMYRVEFYAAVRCSVYVED